MPRKQYCSYCGMELKHYPKALKNRAEIVYLVDPHECDEQYVPNITDSDKPESAFAKEMAERERVAEASEQASIDDNLLQGTPDKRSSDHIRKPITSSAPGGILNQVKSGQMGGNAERKMIDLDEEKGDEESES